MKNVHEIVACALIGNDEETGCSVARWFMKEYQFVTDGYRLFSVLNRLCDTENSWYNCGPSQKYILRQVKAVDFSLSDDTRPKSLFHGRASYSTRDASGVSIQAADMDVALLVLYGHILHAGKSYAYAVSKFTAAILVFTLESRWKRLKLSKTDRLLPPRSRPRSR